MRELARPPEEAFAAVEDAGLGNTALAWVVNAPRVSFGIGRMLWFSPNLSGDRASFGGRTQPRHDQLRSLATHGFQAGVEPSIRMVGEQLPANPVSSQRSTGGYPYRGPR